MNSNLISIIKVTVIFHNLKENNQEWQSGSCYSSSSSSSIQNCLSSLLSELLQLMQKHICAPQFILLAFPSTATAFLAFAQAHFDHCFGCWELVGHWDLIITLSGM